MRGARRRAGKAAAVLLLSLLPMAAGCREQARERHHPQLVAGGDARTGHRLVTEFGCHTCHTVPGVRGATAMVGPPLTGWSRRTYIAGRYANTPENLVSWIYDPPTLHPGTAMPRVGASMDQSRHLAAYLFTLR